MSTRAPMLLLLLAACDTAASSPVATELREGCPVESSVPAPTAPCPTIVDGDVTFCPGGLMSCRDVRVVNASGATGGPLAMHWHGSGERPDDLLAWDTAVMSLASMVEDEGGLLILPQGDPAAAARPGNPFPWWVVCGEDSPSSCNKPDDFILADEVVACAVEQGLVSPSRLTTSGFSAGGIMASHLVDRVDYLAAAVSWSGGLPEGYQPTTPGGTTAVLAMHGGEHDAYCGVGVPPGECYAFTAPAEALAQDVANAGGFAFVCDHQAGHSAAMGNYGAKFLRDGTRSGHTWAGYPFGYPGTGSDWMLNNYCYAAGTPSPWE